MTDYYLKKFPKKQLMMKQYAIIKIPARWLSLLWFAIVLTSLQCESPRGTFAATEMEATQRPEDCGQDQYYYLAKGSCRNCSEMAQTLHSYQEWLGREVGDIRRPNTEQENNIFNRLSQQQQQHQQQQAPARFATADGEILSRLISVDPQNQEYLDSNGQESNQDTIQESNDSSGEDTIVGQARQTQGIVNRFVQSSLIGNELLGTIEQCRQYQNISACQMWSNMCVMTMYSYSDSSTSITSVQAAAAASSPSLALSSPSSSAAHLNHYHHSPHQLKTNGPAHRSRDGDGNLGGSGQQMGASEHEHESRYLIRTWQMCRQFNVNSICNGLRDWLRLERKSNLDIANIYANDNEPFAKIGHSTMRLNQVIQLLAYKYSYDGKFIGVDQFGLEGLENFCILSNKQLRTSFSSTDPTSSSSSTTTSNHVRLGKNMRFKCQFNPMQALKSPNRIKHFNETIFVDLFVGYPLNGAMFVKPVPILIKNLLYNGQQINRKHQMDPSRWKLVHRFFFHTILDLDQPSYQHHPQNPDSNDDGNPSVQGGETTKQGPSTQDENSRHQRSSSSFDHIKGEQVLLYTKSVLLDLKFRRQDKGASVSSLMLTLDYGQLPLQDYGSWETMMVDANSSLAISSSNNNMTTTTTATGVFGTSSRTSQTNNLATLESNIAITQTLIDMTSYKKDLDLAITILSILSAIWALIRCYNIQKCYGIVKLDLETLIRFLLIGCDIVANLFAAITLIFIGFLFLALKLPQSNILVLAPTDDLEDALVVNLQLALLFKLIGLAHKLHVMLNVDVFFIDWEKPKMLTSAEILNHYQSSHSNHLAEFEKGANNSGTTSTQPQTTATILTGNNNTFKWSPLKQQQLQQSQQQSSLWRPYTIINRWLQMQTMRRHNITLQLFLFVCVVEFSQVINLATSDPSLNLTFVWTNNNGASGSNDDGDGEPPNQSSHTHLSPYISTTFRLLIFSIVYMILSVSQILYKKYFYEPMVRNMVHEFVDLCSVANVSLFCMLYPRFGYYIHGRNANGSGDCGIGEMNALLEREERDLCSKRGLAQDSDQQTFVLILPRIINDHYRKLLFRDYDHLLISTATNDNNNNIIGSTNQLNKQSTLQTLNVNRLNQRNKFLGTSNSLIRSALNLSIASSPQSSFGSNRTIIETIVAKNKAINLFLKNFLEHIYKDIDYSIRDRRRFESLLLGVDFDDEMSSTGVSRNLGPPSASAGGVGGGGGLTGINALDQSSTAATFCKDPTNSFTSLLWLGLEFDLVFVELFSLLILDLWLGQPLFITSSLIWLLHQLFKSLYVACARHNLIAKALVDEKFLFR